MNRLTFTALVLLLVACGGVDAGGASPPVVLADAGEDAPAVVLTDADAGVALDAALDAPPDAPSDAAPDVALDAAPMACDAGTVTSPETEPLASWLDRQNAGICAMQTRCFGGPVACQTWPSTTEGVRTCSAEEASLCLARIACLACPPSPHALSLPPGCASCGI